MPEIVFIIGKSSTGKNKIYKKLVEDEDLKLKTVVMYTTRPMRIKEEDGIDYYFVSDDVADQMVADNKVIELRCYNTIYGIWKYFTADDGQIDIHKGNYIIIGTLEVYEKFCQFYGREHLMPIYVEVDDGIRLTRALEREKKQTEPKYTEMCRRFLADDADFSEENIARLGITKRYYNNTEIEDCITEIKKDIMEKFTI